MKNYLSIDLDFWNLYGSNGSLNFLRQVKESNIPVHIVDSHEELLPFINKGKYDTIFNIDYHSDIANNDKDGNLCELNCGTWANHVRHRNRFVWIHPADLKLSNALCHEPQTNKYSPFIHPDIAKYKEVNRLAVRQIPSWVFNDVASIGIAMSYIWLRDYLKEDMKSIVKKIFNRVPKRNCRKIRI
jgi:hypothetical protein